MVITLRGNNLVQLLGGFLSRWLPVAGSFNPGVASTVIAWLHRLISIHLFLVMYEGRVQWFSQIFSAFSFEQISDSASVYQWPFVYGKPDRFAFLR